MSVRFSPDGFLDVATDPSDLPSQMSQKMETSGAMRRCTNLHLDDAGIARTRFGSAVIGNAALAAVATELIEQGGVRYSFAGGVIYRDESSIASGLTAAAWSAILYNAFQSATQAVFATNGTNRKRIEGSAVNEWGIEAPDTEPTLDVGAGTGLTGDYLAVYTYCRKEGSLVVCESNPSPAPAAPQTLSNQSLVVTVTPPTDPQVTHIRIYRSMTNAAVYYHDQDIAVGSTTYTLPFTGGGTYVIAVGDTITGHDSSATAVITGVALTSGTWGAGDAAGTLFFATQTGTFQAEDLDVGANLDVATIAGDSTEETLLDTSTTDIALGVEIEYDHDRPPLGTIVLGPSYDGYVFMLLDNKLYYSKARQPEYWPVANYVEISPLQFPLRNACLFAGTLFCLPDVEIYQVQGTGSSSFFPLPMKAQTGTRGRRALESIKGFGILHLGGDGLYLFTGTEDAKITEQRFGPIFRGETVGSIPGIDRTKLDTCIIFLNKSHVWFGYCSADATYPNNFLVTNQLTGKVVHYAYGREISLLARDNHNNRLLAVDSDGYVLELDLLSATTDNETPIAWEIESKSYADQLYKYFPRYAKYDVELVTPDATATAEILLNDEVKQEHVIRTSRNTNYRLIDSCTGDRLGMRITGTGPAAIYAVEVE